MPIAGSSWSVDRLLTSGEAAGRRYAGSPGALLGRLGVRLGSRLVASRAAKQFAQVRRFCLFVGPSRSGTTLVGSLLDAHPNACIATELDALGYLRRGYSRGQLFVLLRANAATNARRGNEWTGYRYRVPGQWQGRSQRLQVVGDKKAAYTLSTLLGDGQPSPEEARPGISFELIDRVRKVAAVPIRFLHIVRNPFDVIASKHQRDPRVGLQARANHHFSRAAALSALRDGLSPHEFLDVHLEALITDPRRELARLCDFLDLEPSEGYLDACASVVAPSPNRQRDSIDWPREMVARMEAQMREQPHLADYSFAN